MTCEHWKDGLDNQQGHTILRRGTAAAVREWREEAPVAPQVLPKRGDDWARSRTDVQFMQEGHVYFTDSVRPETATPSCSF